MAERVPGLIFTIEVDPSTGIAKLGQVEKKFQTTAQQATAASTKVSGLGTAMSGLGGPLGAAIAQIQRFGPLALLVGGLTLAVTALTSAFRFLVGVIPNAVTAAGEAEAANAQLAQSLRITGQDVEAVLPSMQAYAAELQQLTGVDDDLILKNQSLLVSLGRLRGEGLERATNAALDFAVVTGDVEKAFSLIAKAAAGNTAMLGRYGIVLDESIPKSERFEAALDGIARVASGQAAAALATFGGQARLMQVNISDLQEGIGGPFRDVLHAVLIDAINPLIKSLSDGINRGTAFRNVVLDVAIALAELGAVAEPVIAGMFRLGIIVGSIKLVELERDLKLLKSGLEAQGRGPTTIAGELFEIIGLTGDTDTKFKELAATLRRFRDQGVPLPPGTVGELEDAGAAVTALDEAYKAMGLATAVEVAAKQVQLGLVQEDVNRRFREGAITVDQYVAALVELKKQQDTLSGAQRAPFLPGQPFRPGDLAIAPGVRSEFADQGPPSPFGGRESNAFADAFGASVNDAVLGLEQLTAGFAAGSIPLQTYLDQGASLVETLRLATEAGFVLSESQLAMTDGFANVAASADAVTARLEAQREILHSVARGFAEMAAAQLFASLTGESVNQSLGRMLGQMAKTAAATALFELAAGLAASSGPWGVALFGDPSKHFAAAAQFGIAAGVLAAASAIAGGGGRNASAGAAAPTANPTIPTRENTAPPAGQPLEVRIFVNGQGFVQDLPGFAQEVGAEISRQFRRTGARV